MSLCPPRAGHTPRLPASPPSGRQSCPSSRMRGQAHGQQAVSGVTFLDLCFRPPCHVLQVFLCSFIHMYSFGKLVILQILAERLLGAGAVPDVRGAAGRAHGPRSALAALTIQPFPLPAPITPQPHAVLGRRLGCLPFLLDGIVYSSVKTAGHRFTPWGGAHLHKS